MGAGNSPSWNGQRIAWYWLAGTLPRKTRLSVPRLMPLRMAATRTQPAASGDRLVRRISPLPGTRIQKARAASDMEDAFEHDVLAEIEAADQRTDAVAEIVDRR